MGQVIDGVVVHRHKEMSRLNARRHDGSRVNLAALRRDFNSVAGANSQAFGVVWINLDVEFFGIQLS